MGHFQLTRYLEGQLDEPTTSMRQHGAGGEEAPYSLEGSGLSMVGHIKMNDRIVKHPFEPLIDGMMKVTLDWWKEYRMMSQPLNARQER